MNTELHILCNQIKLMIPTQILNLKKTFDELVKKKKSSDICLIKQLPNDSLISKYKLSFFKYFLTNIF